MDQVGLETSVRVCRGVPGLLSKTLFGCFQEEFTQAPQPILIFFFDLL